MGNRRDFLKTLGAGTAGAAAASCAPVDGDTLIPYLIPPEDVVPGVASWYATTCRECPAGCGVLARVREGRVVKLEGNPEHPGNRGALCPRGQAALHGLYDPDRITGPLVRVEGELQPTDWATGMARLQELLGDEPVGWIGHHVTGALDALIDDLVAARPGSRRARWEALGYGALKAAWGRLTGSHVVPGVELTDADLIVSFGADFLETWLGTVTLTRDFAAARRVRDGSRCRLVQLSPRRGLTGDNADETIAIEPGAEAAVATALAAEVARSLGTRVDVETRVIVAGWLGETDRTSAATAAGADPQRLRALAADLVGARNPVVLGSGHALASPANTDLETAVALIDIMLGAVGRTVFPGRPAPVSSLSTDAELLDVVAMARDGRLGALLLHHADPVHALPAGAGVRDALAAVPLISFATSRDDSTLLADLVLPDHTPLEAWGDIDLGAAGVSLQQPAMRPLHDTRATGDVLLSLLGRDATMHDAVRERWNALYAAAGVRSSADDFWSDSQRRGGLFDRRDAAGGGRAASATPAPADAADRASSVPPQDTRARLLAAPAPLPTTPVPLHGPDDGLPLVVFPTIQMHDGRGARSGWLQESPDPVTKVSWDSWLEIHPQTAAAAGLEDGDAVRVDTGVGMFDSSVVVAAGVRPGTIAVPLGNGHVDRGRSAAGRGVNPLSALPLVIDEAAGSACRSVTRARLTRLGRSPLPRTQIETHDHGRGVARFVTLPATALPAEAGHGPGDHGDGDFYAEHDHPQHRWGMSVDLNACVGCGACEIACAAENNLAVAGPEAVGRGREMSWIRIDRYESDEGTAFVPVMCQHCDHAPCETVCPVNATYHTDEGLNAMVYNRCVGTRYCSNNCPYKVRRFNWSAPEFRAPLDLQLNPDVTPRSVGVMEKCSFCVQRIREGQRAARLDGRDLVDGDITTACAQTCPADAIRFGDLQDSTSAVAHASRGERAYRLFEELNTEPAVSYLARTRLRSGDDG